jgi:predicted esterase YcpF (UPF0227 family)
MNTIVYIHGFGSSCLAKKAVKLREEFGNRVLTPSLPYSPEPAVESLKNLIEYSQQFGKVGLIGASLGGFYALHLAELYRLKAVVVNPAVKPYIRLKEAVPRAINYFDNSSFEWKRENLTYLKSLEIGDSFENILTLLQRGDEVLDYREAENLLTGSKMIIEDGGDHSFIGFESHFKRVDSFLFKE